MRKQRDYWKDSIIDWEEYSYDGAKGGSTPLIEKIAHLFRHAVRHRPILALEILKGIGPKRVLELGCGSGRFAFNLVSNTEVVHVTGVDISAPAIKLAQDKAKKANLEGQLEFKASSVLELSTEFLASFDFVIALGLTPYLTNEEFDHLFKSVKDTDFLFDVHPKKIDLENLAHWFYRKVKGHPFYTLFSQKELFDKLATIGIDNAVWKKDEGVYYIQNF